MTALTNLPCEMVEYTTWCAQEDAERVAAFLDEANIRPLVGGSINLPPGVLLDLAAVCRMRIWEAAGITLHIDAGLPVAQAALMRVIERMEHAAADGPFTTLNHSLLQNQMLNITLRHFAWLGPACLNIDVRIAEDGDEDALLEALARCLWSQRHRTPTRSEP